MIQFNDKNLKFLNFFAKNKGKENASFYAGQRR